MVPLGLGNHCPLLNTPTFHFPPHILTLIRSLIIKDNESVRLEEG